MEAEALFSQGPDSLSAAEQWQLSGHGTTLPLHPTTGDPAVPKKFFTDPLTLATILHLISIAKMGQN